MALVSMKNIEGDVAFNLERHRMWLERALDTGARFVGYPEFSLTGWVNERAQALALRSAPLREVEGWARRRRVFIAVGLVEKRGRFLHNCCALFGPKGPLGCMRKVNLVPKESLHYASGRRIEVFPVAGCTMGVATCADASNQEMFAIPSFMGAEVVFAPHANSLKSYGNHANGWLKWRLENWPGFARHHGIYILGIDNAGLFETPQPGEVETKYCGGGAIFDFRGEVIAKAEVGDTKRECLVTGELDLAAVRAVRKQHQHLNNFRAAIVYNRRGVFRHGHDGYPEGAR